MATLQTIENINARKHPYSILMALRFLPSIKSLEGRTIIMLECMCRCGKLKKVRLSRFIKDAYSCGCFVPKILRPKRGQYPKKLLLCYHNMIDRCYNMRDSDFKYYGAKGVIVCDEWRSNPVLFFEWAIENGWKEGLQLDKDINGTGKLYCPKYCQIVTPKENRDEMIKVRQDKKIWGESVEYYKNIEWPQMDTPEYQEKVKKAKENIEHIINDI